MARAAALTVLTLLLHFLLLATASPAAAGTLNLPSHGTVPLSRIETARKLVADAQARVGVHNKKLFDNPRRNTYVTRDQAHKKHRRADDDLLAPLTVADDVAAAAALLAEADAATGNFTKRFVNVLERAGGFWIEDIAHSGTVPFGPDSSYKVYRNVKDYGAKGDGVTDDTVAINKAITDGNRCGAGCLSSTVKPALVYFPAGVYLVSGSIVALYNTQLVGNPNSKPTIKAAPSFVGLGVISTDVYIDGGNGAEWYINQSNFYRQIRNFKIDITAATVAYPAGLHYQVAQATSLQNIDFIQSNAAGTTQQGIFSENGSGGFMSDLTFQGGNFGFYGGNQQFTVRNLSFVNCKTAIQLIWDWGWTWKSISITGGSVGISLLGEGGQRLTGSVFVQDSKFTNVPTAIVTASLIPGVGKGNTLITLQNVILSNVPVAVQDSTQKTILAGGSTTIASWTLGSIYDPASPNGTFTSGGGAFMTPPTIPSLMGGPNGGYFERSKPQYEAIPASGFTNVKSVGAKGDGVSDDTAAINSALAAAAGKSIVYFPHGSYIVTNTIKVPVGTKIVGECWSQIVGKGPLFANINAPYVMVQVGQKGDVGSVEISDMLFTATGATAGLILMEWNLMQSSAGSAAMWDSHFRVGGAAGTNLQAKDCPIKSGVNPNCIAAAMHLHLTSTSSAYLENVWVWTADHDIDDTVNNVQVNVYTARGILIESQGPTWFYGTASEHNVLYQYEIYSAKNIYMGMIQTESPYFQPNPQAPAPFGSTLGQFTGDLDFSNCPTGSDTAGCATSWGLRVVSSENVIVSGAGLYSWFQDYNQACVDSQNCQLGIVSTVVNSQFYLYNLITIGATQMVTPYSGGALAKRDEISLGPRRLEPRASTTTVVKTLTVIPVQATPSACAGAIGALISLEIVLASENTVYQGHPFSAVVIAWLLEALLRSTCFTQGGPVREGWAAMGDSYGSGVGAGDKWDTSACNRWTGSAAYQMDQDKRILWNEANWHFFQFIACSAARTWNLFAESDKFKNEYPQAEQFRWYDSNIATLSVGGNDVGFFDILDGCVYWFYAFRSTTCDAAIAKSQSLIDSANFTSNLNKLYGQILDFAHPLEGPFTLYVTGYARFWNAATSQCDEASMGFWPGYKPKLTKDVRLKMNTVLLNLNAKIKVAVANVNAGRPPNRHAVFVDYDSVFEGHRFCEADATEPQPINANNWFFQLKDQDTDASGHNHDNLNSQGAVKQGTLPDPVLCKVLINNGTLDDWGERAACLISLAHAENSSMVLPLSSDYSGPEYSRIFHPKTIGYNRVYLEVLKDFV